VCLGIVRTLKDNGTVKRFVATERTGLKIRDNFPVGYGFLEGFLGFEIAASVHYLFSTIR
jgi:hypothetical protein